MLKNSIYVFVSFFVLGIFISEFFHLYIFEVLFFSFLIFFSISIFFRKNNIFLIIFLFYFFFIFGFLRNFIFLNTNVGDLDRYLNENISYTVVVDEIPEVKKYKTKNIGKILESKSRVIFWTSKYSNLEYGDKLNIDGYLVKINNFKIDNNREFDYISFLKKDEIFYELKVVDYSLISKNEGSFIKEKLFSLRKNILDRLKSLIPEEKGALMSGLLLGAKETMSKETLESFRKSGIIHIVVLSGFNLTLVADFFMKIFSIFGLTVSSILGSVSIFGFVVLTGATSTVVRASLMALIVIYANYTGKKSNALKALFLALFFMLAYNPSLLFFDPSFQLSFLASFGLLFLSDKISEKIKIIPNKFLSLREILSATLATQIFVFPFLMYLMGEISIISPIVNLLVLIIVPFVMFLGFLTILVSFFSSFLALLFAFISYYLLFYILFISDFFAKFPFAVYENKSFSLLACICIFLFYLILYLIFLIFKKKKLK